MIQEIKNMDEYNPRYTKNGALKWQHINDGRNKKKEFPMIPLDKIVIGKRKYEEENLKHIGNSMSVHMSLCRCWSEIMTIS